jgi:molybdopterin converting factor small subunit
MATQLQQRHDLSELRQKIEIFIICDRSLRTGEYMPVTIEIPTAFRRFTDGSPQLDCNATTVAEALNILTAQFPGLSRHVRDDQGQIRQFLNVYLNEEDIRFLGGEACTVKEGDRVLLVPSIAGGCREQLVLIY